MVDVVLVKAAVIPGRPGIRPSGYACEVSEDVFAALMQRGVVAAPPESDADEVAEIDVLEAAGAADEVAEIAAPPEPDADEVNRRPNPTASVDAWRSYCREQGIDPKGLSRAQMIHATS